MKKVNWNSFLFILLVGFFASTSLINCAIVSDNMSPATKQKIIAVLDSYPEGYENWTNTASKVVLEKNDFYGFQKVLVSKKALKAYKTGGQQYQEGSQLVLEFSEPISEGTDIIKGGVNWIAVMTKKKSKTDTGGWLYEAYTYGKSGAVKKDMDVVTGCYNCHTAMKNKDYVFSSPTQVK